MDLVYISCLSLESTICDDGSYKKGVVMDVERDFRRPTVSKRVENGEGRRVQA